MDRPLKTYNGGKAGHGTYQQIINFIPKCEIFIDTMVGNGGVVCNLQLPGCTVINDIDTGIIDGFKLDGQQKVIKENLGVMDLIDKYERFKINDRFPFFYFDPPYLKSSRKSQRNLYDHEWSEIEHINFLTRVLTVENDCMISHYPCPLYDAYLKSWNKHTFMSTTRQGQAVEAIYMNYPPPFILQDFRYIGNDFTDRQRIKRKVNRLLKKLDELPTKERIVLIAAVIDKYSYTSKTLIRRNGL